MANSNTKLYVWDKVEKTSDKEELQIVKVYESQPNEFTYLVFIEK
jgi:hypothetical protein